VVFALRAELTKNFFAVNWLYALALDVILATVKHGVNLGQFRKVPCPGILDQILGMAPGCSGKFLKTRCGFWRKSDDHVGQSRGAA
jgi:hypothetical protein